MIRFSLHCDEMHDFEGWFRSGEDYESQKARRLVVCPVCGSACVSKALMAPAVSTGRQKDKMALAIADEQRKTLTKLKELTQTALSSAEDVGDKFAEEARKMHYGETDQRGIRGAATIEEAEELLDEGIPVLPVPVFPDEHN